MSETTIAVLVAGAILLLGILVARDLESQGLAALMAILAVNMAGGALRAARPAV